MFSKVTSCGLFGVDAYRVDVEVECSGGMGQICIVGLPDAAVKESQERVRAAIRSCRVLMPPGKKWVVNLAPADTRKEGPALDLPIAVGILSATGHIPSQRLADIWLVGELGLDGSVRNINGLLSMAMTCRSQGISRLIFPESNLEEAELVEGLDLYPVGHLHEVMQILLDPKCKSPIRSQARKIFSRTNKGFISGYDLSEVKGQTNAKRALMIAAAGRHNMMMVGPPGSGKSMLAQRILGVLPPLEFDEALELTRLYSAAGKLNDKAGVVSERPFRSPHHSASQSGLVGGGAQPKPGEISLSHLGVLFLDELTEFPRSHLESLRQPLETGTVTISRAHNSYTFPSKFLLVAACNPCPCGYRGDQVKSCTCTPYQAERYWSRISGPILDRIDLHVEVRRLSESELSGVNPNESSEKSRLRVMRAVDRQRLRSRDGKLVFNSQLSQAQMREFCFLDNKGREFLANSVTQMGLSARAYDRVLRTARTIADLDGFERINNTHLAEAVRFRAVPGLANPFVMR